MKNILVWAHRGASGIMPENTLPAFAKAVELGADGVELDIQMSADGEIVVIHDEMVDRTSDGKGWVKDFTLEQLRQLDVSYGHKELGHVCIPTMREVFELLKPTELTINIELKTGILDYPGMEEKILILTREYGFEDRVIYSSFNHYSILKIQKLDPSAKTAFLYADGPIDMPQGLHGFTPPVVKPADIPQCEDRFHVFCSSRFFSSSILVQMGDFIL